MSEPCEVRRGEMETDAEFYVISAELTCRAVQDQADGVHSLLLHAVSHASPPQALTGQ